ncbi:hypothetical protein [Roseibium aestuarii]|uniref:Uncharacterized protein n=1 Tax=Roseibium aestuarii TaxID=2600299 RepID=A0ABW4JWQ3_9HYPH|nr:hypothetical protein [Roseibium aestuarii]
MTRDRSPGVPADRDVPLAEAVEALTVTQRLRIFRMLRRVLGETRPARTGTISGDDEDQSPPDRSA